MAINGIAALRYAVGDCALATKFFQDFGLELTVHSEDISIFTLEEGSSVEIDSMVEHANPDDQIEGAGVHEIVWGVESSDHLERYVDDLSRDHDIQCHSDGSIHFVPAFGIPMALRVFPKKPVIYAPEPTNAPGNIRRLNSPRKWRRRAFPKVLNHVVFQSPHYEAAAAFMSNRLDFRLTDIQEGLGIYLRASGSYAHHNIMFANANAPMLGGDGRTRFHHTNFGVEDLDEIMLGVNRMARLGWETSEVGLGRHRIDSALFYYMPCPAGGEAEYGADADYVDNNWVPRRWDPPLFGYAHFAHNLPRFFFTEPDWRFSFIDEEEGRELLSTGRAGSLPDTADQDSA